MSLPADIDEAAELAFEIANSASEGGLDGTDVAIKLVDLGRSIAESFGGDVAAIVSEILGAIPFDELIKWLESFRTVVVKIREGSLAIGAGVDAEVDLSK